MKPLILREILEMQKKEVQNRKLDHICERKEEILLELDSPLAQIVIGVRRCGKSSLCHRFLKKNTIHYAYINFDDENLIDFTKEDFNQLMELLYVVYGDFTYIFIDEPQNISHWHLFINRLLRQQFRIFLTGSNAKLLSSELATHLTGRYNQVELYPFSFSEFSVLKNININPFLPQDKAKLSLTFEEYLEKGGFPELLHIKSWKNYIRTLFTAVVDRDIIQRFNVRHKQALHDIANFAISNFAQEFNYNQIANSLQITTDQTVKNYLFYLEQAYLIVGINKFSFKSRERIRNRKFYLIDTAFASAMSSVAGLDIGWKLENVVLIELLRRRYETLHEIHYYKNGYEIDFVISNGRKVQELIQVSVDISSPKTRKREIKSLLQGSEKLNCNKLTLIVLGESEILNLDDKIINIVKISDWLLSPELR